MHSYETLAVIALALSATPVFSAPVVDNQQQARAAVEEPVSGGGGLLSGVLKNVGLSVGASLLGDAAKHFFGNHTRRDTDFTPSTLHFGLPTISNNGNLNAAPTLQGGTVHFEQRAPGLGEENEGLENSKREPSIGKSVLGFVASSIGSEIASHFLNENHSRREPENKLVGDAISAGELLAHFLKREPEPENKLVGDAISAGEFLSHFLKREDFEELDLARREPENKLVGDAISAGELLAHFLKREPEPENKLLGDIISAGGLLAHLLKREPEPENKLVGDAISAGELLAHFLKREPQPENKLVGDAISVGELLAHFLKRQQLEELD